MSHFLCFTKSLIVCFVCDNVLHKLEILYSSLTRLCFKRNPAELHHDGAHLSLRYFLLYAGSLCLFSAGPTVAQLERYSLILTLCEPFSLFHQIIDSLFLCDNVLHKLEILYSSLTRLCFKRNPAESRAQIWRHNATSSFRCCPFFGSGSVVVDCF